MKKFMAMIMMVCMLCGIMTPVMAEAATTVVPGQMVGTNLILGVSKSGKLIDDVYAWKDSEGDIFVNDVSTLKKIFPVEAAGLNSERVPSPVPMADYAKVFGYKLGVTVDNILLITANGDEVVIPTPSTTPSVPTTTPGAIPTTAPTTTPSSAPESTMVPTTTPSSVPATTAPTTTPSSAPESTISPTTTPEPTTVPTVVKNLKVYRDGGSVSVTVEEWKYGKDVYVDNFVDLYKVFWRETNKLTVPNYTKKVNLTKYAEMFGCTVEVNQGAKKVLVKTKSGVMSDTTEIWLNGKKLSISGPNPYIQNGTVVIPTSVFKKIGASVKIQKNEKLAVITRGKKYVRASIGSNKYFSNGKEGKATVKTVYKKYNGKNVVMVPATFLKALGVTVTWNSRTNRLFIIDEKTL